MKKNILKTTALFIVLSGLLFSCTLFEDDSPSETVTAVATKSEAAKKAVLSLSVAGEEASRTALPSVSSAQEFESFDFEANNGAASITKSWTGDSEKTAYTKMTSESFEMDAGIWTLILTAKKGGMTYTGTLNKELVAGANSIEFTLALSELSNEGKGSVEIKLSVPTNVKAVTATLCNTEENTISDSSITQSANLTNNTINYSVQNVPSGTYLVVFNLYADSEKTLLLGKWREYAGITRAVTSKSEIAIAAEDLDKVYTITYELNGGTLKGNWAGSYTRQMTLTFPMQKDLVNNEGLKFDGWYKDAACTQLFDATTCSGNLTLHAKWRNWYAAEVTPAINNGTLTGTQSEPASIVVEEITSEQLTGIASAMKSKQCYLSLDLSKTTGLSTIGNVFWKCTSLRGISIPKTVTSIGDYAFYECSGLESVTIPSSVTSIGAHAFEWCSGLKSVTISEGVTSIGADAFYGCNGLESVTIPSSVTSIGAHAFERCSGLKSVTISEGVTSIGAYAFYGCNGLERVTIPSSVTSIGGAFEGCSRLTEMTIPFAVSIPTSVKSVTISYGATSIGDNAFQRCSGLESVTIPSSVTRIGAGAFQWCSGLKSVYYDGTLEQWLAISFGSNPCRNGSDLYIQGNKITGDLVIPSGVTSIGYNAFYGCSGLKSVTISEGVTSIGYNAFYGCSGLERVTIPSSVTDISCGAFSGCSWLTEMTIPFVGESVSATGLSSLFGDIFGNSSYTGGTATYMYYSSSSESATYYIPSSLKTVTVLGGQLKYGAFSGCSRLESVTIPSSVTSIGDRAFSGCSGLESVTIPSSVTSIGARAFEGCSRLKSVYYDGTLEQWLAISFGSNPCCNGSDLYIQGNKITDLVIPEGVTSIGDYAFSGCSGLESVTIPSSVTSIGSSAFYGCSGLKSVTIPSKVTSIGDCAFSGCSGLESVTIPSSVTRIRSDAFKGCSRLKSVYYDGTLKQWLAMSFDSYDCNPCCNESDLYIQGNKITDLVIPEGVESIRWYAFRGCSGLESVTIPSSVTSIGERAFSGCSGLKSVYYGGTLEQWLAMSFDSYGCNPCCNGSDLYIQGNKITDLVIPEGVTSIGSYAFEGCSGLESVTIPSSVTSIGERAFSGCSGLKRVTIPSSVTSIGWWAFRRCSGLESVTIPSSVTSIRTGTFSGCCGLKRVTIPNSVISIGYSAFSGCSGLTEITIPFVGESADATDAKALFGVIFGTSEYAGGTATKMYFSISSCETYYIPSSLETVKVTGGQLNYGAFYGCSMLTSVTIPDSVKSIGEYVFYECSGFTSVTIPSSVTSIGDSAFSGCSGLTNVYYRGSSSQWNQIEISDGNDKLKIVTKKYNYTGK